MRDKLKPCPFCGSINIDPSKSRGRNLDGFATIAAGCSDCGALGPLVAVICGSGYTGSIAAWNTRHVPEGFVMVPVEANDTQLSVLFGNPIQYASKTERYIAQTQYAGLIKAAQDES